MYDPCSKNPTVKTPIFLLYVDEISPDKIKATVSDRNTVYHNLQTMALDMPFPTGIILDLTGKEELAEKMAEKLRHVDLQERFMNAYAEMISHPENRQKFRLVVGNAEDPRG